MSIGVIVLLGAPGSGKGTQAKALAAKNSGWIQISTGDLFRAEIASGSTLGNAVKDIMASGKLVSDDVTNQVFESQVAQILSKQKPRVLMLDGYPRTGPQAESLKRFCAKTAGLETPAVIEFFIEEQTVIKRLADRLVNPRTGKIYHRVMNPPKKAGFCDDDGGPLIQRPDDQPETIKKRFKIYADSRDDIVSSLGGQASVKVVNADQPQEAVLSDLSRAIQAALIS